ncbi:MAG: YolD-like family protein [Bacillota bacterium]
MRDRGSIKWSSLMLPEHKELLKKLAEEQNHVKKPILTEDRYEQINQTLIYAIKNSLPISIKFYQSNSLYTVQGVVKMCDPLTQKLKLIDNANKELILYLEQIIDSEIISGSYE